MQLIDRKNSKNSMPLILIFAMGISSLCDLPTYHYLGGFSGTAILSTIYAFFLISLVPIVILNKLPKVLVFTVPFLLFSLWNLILLFYFGADKAGYQTVTLYLNFTLNLFLVTVLAKIVLLSKFDNYFFVAAMMISLLYLYVVLSTGIGMSGIVGRRSFALEAVILLCWFAFQVRDNSLSNTFIVWSLFALILLSLSRTAIVLSILIMAMRILRRRSESKVFSFRNMSISLLFTIATLVTFIEKIPLFRERVIGGDRAFNIGGYSISSQGRNRIWSTVLDNARDSIWIGHGPGSVRALISTRIPGQTEPHNEFLRIYYESGIVGLSLYGAGVISIIYLFVKTGRGIDHLRFSAISTSICFLILALTDNPGVYIFVILPFSTILGIYMSRQDRFL